jgi:hypothetical protein
MLVRLAMLMCTLAVTGCAGVSTLPVYTASAGAWASQGGNPVVLMRGPEKVELSVLGLWPHRGRVGPLGVPLFPTDGASRRITLEVKAQPFALVETIQEVSLIADGATLELLGRDARVDAVLFHFRQPPSHPTELRIKVGSLPEASLVVAKERCYWFGDSYSNYVSCSEAAKSADPH